MNARTSSGGVGFLVRTSLLSDLEVSVIGETVDDVIWIKMKYRTVLNICFCICVCYLPPANSSRPVCASLFYDKLLKKVYLYHTYGTVVICGDLNSRLGLDYSLDYIEGIDDIPSRNVLDHHSNGYGTLLADFLVRSNMCVLNGRSTDDDYTCLSRSHGILG